MSRFVFDLAFEQNMTVKQVLQTYSDVELLLTRAYIAGRKWTARRADYNSAMIAKLLYDAHKTKSSRSLRFEDFLQQWEPIVKAQSDDEQVDWEKQTIAMFRAVGRVKVKNGKESNELSS